MTQNTFKVIEMFSGIGSQAKALSILAKKHDLQLNIVNTCEWNIHAFIAYDIIHNENFTTEPVCEMPRLELIDTLSKKSISFNGVKPINRNQLISYDDTFLKLLLTSINNTKNLINVKETEGKDIPDNLDLLTYSFPCQDLSNVGSIHGYNKGIDRDSTTRSGLLWEIERILIEKKSISKSLPKFLLLENVAALNSKRHRTNFEEWQARLSSLGYYNHIYNLNSNDFGVPQNRQRLIMLSIWVGKNKTKIAKLEKFYNNNTIIHRQLKTSKSLKDILRLDYSNNVLFNEALLSQPNNTESRRKIWSENYVLYSKDKKLASKSQTITTKQDRNPNSGNIYFNYKGNKKSKFRYLTPRECFMLMGFEESDYEKIIKTDLHYKTDRKFFTRDILYKLAGNSIVVNVLEAVFENMLEINTILNQKKTSIRDKRLLQ